MTPLLLSAALVLSAAVSAVKLREDSSHLTGLVAKRSQHDYRFTPPASNPGVEDDLHLLDIVLVASVDGKFHALNRTSGHKLWSMSSPSSAPLTTTKTATTTTSSSSSSSFSSSTNALSAALSPLVRTAHNNDEGELYVIEPQTGDIYIMNSGSSSLQRLDFSMPQLVDMSPFSFAGDEDRRVFVGKKETSLLQVELETGKITATINTECPWDPMQDLSDDVMLDLDELEGMAPPKATEVYIGRTDYYISIYSRSNSGSSIRTPIQNLSFSTYGPNNQDNALQAVYRRTADNAYVQPLPNGNVFAFRATDTMRNSKQLWGNQFDNPIVAVFDVVQSKTTRSSHPFVLLQPRPRLEDLDSPGYAGTSPNDFPNFDSAYVGLVEETGSLFTMTPSRFPLVVFGDANLRLGSGSRHDIDALTRQRQWREYCEEEASNIGGGDRRCLVGVRPLQAGSSRSMLLDGAPFVQPSPLPSEVSPVTLPGDEAEGVEQRFEDVVALPLVKGSNSSIKLPWLIMPGNDTQTTAAAVLATANAFWGVCSFLFAVAYGVFWFMSKKKRATVVSPPSTVVATSPSSSEDVPEKSVQGQVLAVARVPLEPVPDHPAEVIVPAAATAIVTTPSTGTASDEAAQSEAGDISKEVGEGSPQLDVNGTTVPASPKPSGKRTRRGGRGNGKKKKSQGDDKENNGVDGALMKELDDVLGELAPPSLLVPPPSAKVASGPSLVVSDKILGFGSHGTVVYEGSLQGRAVAVKRLLQDFVTLASREVSILQESDDHPNVIRYYYQEAHANFLYIALELCPASLADIVERPDAHAALVGAFDPKRALRQITAGLRHLHALKIVHRDIKPQNILISQQTSTGRAGGGYRMLISDFGLCKKLDVDQTSFLPTAQGAMAAGTVGWRAPEILRGEVTFDEALMSDDSLSSRGSTGTVTGFGGSIGSTGSSGTTTNNGKPTRLTKSVDIFALGCLFYYVLTSGGHPYGDRFEREGNIMKDNKNLEGVERFGEEGIEAAHLIAQMLAPEPSARPDTTKCLIHPFFWDSSRRLTFLQDASDRFEIMCRDPRDPNLVTLETKAVRVVGNDWHSRLDKIFIDNLGKFRKYDGKSVQDLLRALRNKKNHYQDLPDNVKRHLGPMPEGFLAYFTRRYPYLFLHVHGVISETALHTESMFRSYYEPPEI